MPHSISISTAVLISLSSRILSPSNVRCSLDISAVPCRSKIRFHFCFGRCNSYPVTGSDSVGKFRFRRHSNLLVIPMSLSLNIACALFMFRLFAPDSIFNYKIRISDIVVCRRYANEINRYSWDQFSRCRFRHQFNSFVQCKFRCQIQVITIV